MLEAAVQATQAASPSAAARIDELKELLAEEPEPQSSVARWADLIDLTSTILFPAVFRTLVSSFGCHGSRLRDRKGDLQRLKHYPFPLDEDGLKIDVVRFPQI